MTEEERKKLIKRAPQLKLCWKPKVVEPKFEIALEKLLEECCKNQVRNTRSTYQNIAELFLVNIMATIVPYLRYWSMSVVE